MKENEHEVEAGGEKTDGPETQNLPANSEFFVLIDDPRLGVLASDSLYADDRQTSAPDKHKREGEDL